MDSSLFPEGLRRECASQIANNWCIVQGFLAESSQFHSSTAVTVAPISGDQLSACYLDASSGVSVPEDTSSWPVSGTDTMNIQESQDKTFRDVDESVDCKFTSCPKLFIF